MLENAPSLNLQFGGDGGDLFNTGGDLGFQMGQEGNDIFLGGGSFNFSFGGTGDDLMMMTGEKTNFVFGQDGGDWLIDTGAFSDLFWSAVFPQLPDFGSGDSSDAVFAAAFRPVGHVTRCPISTARSTTSRTSWMR